MESRDFSKETLCHCCLIISCCSFCIRFSVYDSIQLFNLAEWRISASHRETDRKISSILLPILENLFLNLSRLDFLYMVCSVIVLFLLLLADGKYICNNVFVLLYMGWVEDARGIISNKTNLYKNSNSNFAHRFSLCTLKIQYWQLFSYLNSYAMLLEAVSSVKQVPCS